MNDAIREAFDLGKRFAAAYDAVDEAGMDRIEKEFSTLQSQTALSANGGEVAKSAAHSDYGYIPSKDHQWFFYDPEGDGMTFCKTEEEAFSGADQAIWQSLDECWSECVDQICYGKIVQAAAQVDRVDRPENVGADGYTPDGAHWPQDCEFMCNYRLESVTHPAPPSVAVPDDVTATPSPDHSGDANKMAAPSAPENEAETRGAERVLHAIQDAFLEDDSPSGPRLTEGLRRAILIAHAEIDEIKSLRTAGDEGNSQ